MIESADNKPTDQSVEVFNELSAQLDAQLQKMQDTLKTELPRLNAALKREKIDAVDPKAKPAPPTGAAEVSTAGHGGAKPAPRGRQLAVLTLGALGIVYGDIGTSPLYALRECFHGPHGIAPTPDNVLGVLSLIFWSLTLIVSIKYLIFVMRADNDGEGGILALMALVSRQDDAARRSRTLLIALGLFGAALLYGDGMITPAISVLGAVEGLTIATHIFEPYVVAITVTILVGLFLIQSRGTGQVGAMFGPIMIVWFVTIAVMGVSWIRDQPSRVLGSQPGERGGLLLPQRQSRLYRARIGLPGRHGR